MSSSYSDGGGGGGRLSDSQSGPSTVAAAGSGGGGAKTNAELKLVIIGREGAGKSCLMMQYVRHCFLECTEPTDSIGDMNYTQRVVDGVAYRLQIIDTAGQEEYSVFQQQYYSNGHGFLAVLDLGDRRSMTDLHSMLTRLGRVKDMDNGDVHNVPCVLVANKCDLHDSQKEITKQDLDVFKRQYDTFPFFETSAKVRHNVDEAFESLIRQTQRSSGGPEEPANSRGKSKKNKKPKSERSSKPKCNLL